MVDDAAPLREEDVDPDPFAQFGRWYDEASPAVPHPQAMVVATAGSDGRPSARMVLLKEWGPEGFAFYTNLGSRKGTDLAANPHAALLFYWEPLGRQIRIEGAVEHLSDTQSDRYFATRPRGAQIGARASDQSAPIGDRHAIEARVDRLRGELEGREVPRPPGWGGLRVVASEFEFWQNRADRVHDRLRYRPEGDRWRIDRLQP